LGEAEPEAAEKSVYAEVEVDVLVFIDFWTYFGREMVD
jgi:hypothetical protein